MKKHLILAISAMFFGVIASSAQAPASRIQSNPTDSSMNSRDNMERKDQDQMKKQDGTSAPGKGTGNTDTRSSPERKVSPASSTTPSTPATAPEKEEIRPITPEGSATPKGSVNAPRISSGQKVNRDGKISPPAPAESTTPSPQ